jgi:AraC-like DNA-binding protein
VRSFRDGCRYLVCALLKEAPLRQPHSRLRPNYVSIGPYWERTLHGSNLHLSVLGARVQWADIPITLELHSDAKKQATRRRKMHLAPYKLPTDDGLRHVPLSKDKRLAATQRFALRNLSKKTSLDQAARISCLEKHYFASLFRRSIGKSFIAWQREQRVHWCLQLLSNTTLSIESVASTVGYADCTGLERAFRHVLGITPRNALHAALTRRYSSHEANACHDAYGQRTNHLSKGMVELYSSTTSRALTSMGCVHLRYRSY